MSRRLSHLALILVLLFAQLQVLVHPLQHLAQRTAVAQGEVKSNHLQDAQHEETCGKCISLAGLGSAVQSNPLVVTPPSVPETPTFAFFISYSQRFSAQYQSRAPPRSLIV